MKHKAHKPEVAVGGTCVKTICLARFATSAQRTKRRTATWSILSNHYGELIHPGAWIRWIWENAPPRLAQLAIELQFSGAVKRDEDLHVLIGFHDRKRLYPRDALIDYSALAACGIGPIPHYLTLHQARQLERQGGKPCVMNMDLTTWAYEYRKDTLERFLPAGSERRRVWREMTEEERQGLTALCALQDIRRAEGVLLPSELANFFVPLSPNLVSQFVWNPHLGVAFSKQNQIREDGKGCLWFWADKGERDNLYDLTYWRSVRPVSLKSLWTTLRMAFRSESRPTQ